MSTLQIVLIMVLSLALFAQCQITRSVSRMRSLAPTFELGVLLSQAVCWVLKCFGRRRLVPLLMNDLAVEGKYVRLGP